LQAVTQMSYPAVCAHRALENRAHDTGGGKGDYLQGFMMGLKHGTVHGTVHCKCTHMKQEVADEQGLNAMKPRHVCHGRELCCHHEKETF